MGTKEQTKLAAIVFTDIVGYTQKMDADEKLTMHYLDRQREIVYPIVEAYGGEVVKEIGDGLLMMFDSSVKAVRCAVEIQTKLKDEEFKIRAGIHMGDVILKDGDVFGAAVNIAARIEPQALAGGICISQVVRNQIKNKIDIQTISVGVKEFKGVKEQMEVFDVVFADAEIRKISLFTHLWQRRVPHITAIYTILVLFTYLALEYIASTYLLSPHLVQFGTILLLSLFPSAILIGYFHGKKASGEWTKIERFGLPINIVISAVLLFTIFSNKDLGAATKTVNVINEDGQVIEREITKNEFRKSVGLFFFENETSDTTLNWLQYSVPFMIGYDLLQDIFIRTESSFNLFPEIIDEGYSPEKNLPLVVQQRIAKQRHLNYFVTGTINNNTEKNGLIVSVKVRNSNTSRVIAEKEFAGSNIFEISDEISRQLKYDIGIPEGHIEAVSDLPLTELLTTSESALKSHLSAMSQRLFYNDYEKAQILSEQAIAEDPDFIIAYAQLIDIYLSTSQKELSDKSYEKVMQNIVRLPEQIQFRLKYSYYLLIQQDPDRASAVVKMWKELYPYDIQAYELSATLYQLKNKPSLAIKEFQEILKLDPDRYDYYLNIADLYSIQGKYDEALSYNKKYSTQFPESSRPLLAIGDLYTRLRDFGNAKNNYEKVLLIEHDNISAALGLANIDLVSGKYDQVEMQYQKILDYCKLPQDKYVVYRDLVEYYDLIGQMNNSLSSMESQYEAFSKYTEPINVIINASLQLKRYVKAGKADKAFEIIKDYEKELTFPINKFISLGYMSIYLATENADDIEASIPALEDAIQSFRYDVLRPFVNLAQARVYHLRGEYTKAIDVYKELLLASPTDMTFNQSIGVCYKELKDYENAIKYVQIVLDRSPFNAKYNYEMAAIHAEMGNNEKALEYLAVALEVWKNADANYKLAQQAKDLFQQLSD